MTAAGVVSLVLAVGRRERRSDLLGHGGSRRSSARGRRRECPPSLSAACTAGSCRPLGRHPLAVHSLAELDGGEVRHRVNSLRWWRSCSWWCYSCGTGAAPGEDQRGCERRRDRDCPHASRPSSCALVPAHHGLPVRSARPRRRAALCDHAAHAPAAHRGVRRRRCGGRAQLPADRSEPGSARRTRSELRAAIARRTSYGPRHARQLHHEPELAVARRGRIRAVLDRPGGAHQRIQARPSRARDGDR